MSETRSEMSDQYKSLFESVVSALAAIDRELDMPEDGCNSPAATLAAIRELKARAALQQSEGWRPIETAPSDGRFALVYRPLAEESGDSPIALKRLIGGNNQCWDCTVPPGQKPCNPTNGACHVTHWMPIPDSPK